MAHKPKTAFQTAERYIQLTKVWETDEWVPLIKHINEMILMPLIAFFSYCAGYSDIMFCLSTFVGATSAWTEYAEFVELTFVMQRMELQARRVGGPFISTNDPTYMPYVWADAVTRESVRQPCSGNTRRR
jgi:hypothetical protein